MRVRFYEEVTKFYENITGGHIGGVVKQIPYFRLGKVSYMGPKFLKILLFYI